MRSKLTIEGEKCERCGHEFIPRSHQDDPICPACRRPTRL